MAIRKIGACWKTKSGKGYNCVIDKDKDPVAKFSIFKNEKKTEDRHPDLNIVVFDEDEPETMPDDDSDVPF